MCSTDYAHPIELQLIAESCLSQINPKAPKACSIVRAAVARHFTEIWDRALVPPRDQLRNVDGHVTVLDLRELGQGGEAQETSKPF